MDVSLNILGIQIALAGPDSAVGPVDSAYRRFRCPLSTGDSSVRIVADVGEIDVDGRKIPVIRDVDLTLQIYQQFLLALFDRVEDHAMIHAAALTGADGHAFLLAGPSGHGKSSLSLELAARGHGFLTDDYSPLELSTREIWPYPRAVGIDPSGSAPIPSAFRSHLAEPGTARLFEKILIDVGDVLGESAVARAPAPLKRVVILAADTDDGAGSSGDRFRVVVRAESAERIERELANLVGTDIVPVRELDQARVLDVRIAGDSPPGRKLSRILNSDEAVLASERIVAGKPDFSRTPALTRISRRESALFLCREMLNRREGGRLLTGFGDDVTAMFLEVASLLRDCDCFRLSVGRFEETVDRLQELVGTASA